MFKAWTPKEEEELLQEYKEISLDEIAEKHNRSKRAIETRLQDIAVKLYNENTSEEDILSLTGINKDILLKRKEYKDKEKIKKTKNNDEPINSNTDINDLRLEIKDLKLEIKDMRMMYKELTNLIIQMHSK